MIPLCPLQVNLYGHPLAGFCWENHGRAALAAEGFEPVNGWECLYVHRKDQLFLNVYVDDFHMAGNAMTMKTMWTKLRKRMGLDTPVPFDGNIYLGCQQQDITISPDMVKDKQKFACAYLSIPLHFKTG